jgi:hypothetical protein
MNPGFLEPMPPLPDGLDGDGPEAVHEVMNGCAWLVVARKAAGVPAAPATAKVFGYGGRAASE